MEFFLEDQKLQRGLKTTERKLGRFGRSLRGAGAAMLGFGGALAAPFAVSIKAAADLEETMNKFNVVFGENAKQVKEWGDTFAAEVGRSRQQIADFLSSAQDLLVPIGFESGAAEELSKDLTRLAVDLASFNNMADADVMRDLQAALTGSGEVMKKYGVLVSEAAVKQELLNQGLDPKTADNTQKAMARLNIIMRGTTAAQGDAIRSAGSFTNQMKALKASVSDAAAEVGTALLPVVTPLVSKVVEVTKEAAAWITKNHETVVVLAEVTAAVVAVGGALVILGGTVQAVSVAIGGINTLLFTVIPAIIKFGSTMTSAGVAATALKVALVSGVAVAAGIAATAIYKANGSVQAFNESIREMNRLTAESDKRFNKMQERVLGRAAELEGGERSEFLDGELSRAQKELEGTNASIAGQKKIVDGLDTVFNRVTGNKILESEQAVLKEQQQRADQLRSFIEALKDRRGDEAKPEPKPGENDPAKSLDETGPVFFDNSELEQFSGAGFGFAGGFGAGGLANVASAAGLNPLNTQKPQLTVSDQTLRDAADQAFNLGLAGFGGLAGLTGAIGKDEGLAEDVAQIKESAAEATRAAVSVNRGVDIRSEQGQEAIALALTGATAQDGTVNAIASQTKVLKDELEDTNKALKKGKVLKAAT